jgi:hypothetical protein
VKNVNTNIGDIVNRDCLVYSILADPSEESKKLIAIFQNNLSIKFPGVIWKTPPTALHITLLVLVNIMKVDHADGDEFFKRIFPRCDEFLENTFSKYSTIKIEFVEIKASQDAIILVGKDKGEFQKIRNEFVKEMSLEIKQPNIIHITIARFNKEYPLNDINEFLKTQNIFIKEYINRFKLSRETKKPMLDFKIEKYYII